jgi:ribosome-associated toxin RatA of RatAB toxin-antitoxin module
MSEKGSESILIEAPPEKILEVVAAIETYPEWMPAFKLAEVRERDSEGRPSKAEFEVDARIKQLQYVLKYTYTDTGLSWRSISGDVKEIVGSYSLEPSGDSTKVTYEYSIDPGFPIPGFLRRQGVKMMVDSALKDLKNRAESI